MKKYTIFTVLVVSFLIASIFYCIKLINERSIKKDAKIEQLTQQVDSLKKLIPVKK